MNYVVDGRGDRSSLYNAVSVGDLDLVEILVASGADVHHQRYSYVDGGTILHLACMVRNFDKGKKRKTSFWNEFQFCWRCDLILFEFEFEFSNCLPNYLKNRAFGIVKFFIEKGVKVSIRNNNEETALRWAITVGCF